MLPWQTTLYLPTCARVGAWVLKASSCWHDKMMQAATLLLIWLFGLKILDGVRAEVVTRMLRKRFAVFLAGCVWWLGYQGCSAGDKVITWSSSKLKAKSSVWALLYTFDKQLSWLQPQHRTCSISKTETTTWYPNCSTEHSELSHVIIKMPHSL